MDSLHSWSGAQLEMMRMRITGVIIHLSLAHKTKNGNFTSFHLNYLFSGELSQAKKKKWLRFKTDDFEWGAGRRCSEGSFPIFNFSSYCSF